MAAKKKNTRSGKTAAAAKKKPNVLLVILILVIIVALVLMLAVFRDEFGNMIRNFGGGGDDGGNSGGSTSGRSVLGGNPTVVLPDEIDMDAIGAEVHFIDVGQGDSAVMRFADGMDVIIDGGTSAYSKANDKTGAGNHNIQSPDDYIAYLGTLNIDKFDYMLVTHQDKDHISFLSKVLDNYDVENIYYSPALPAVSEIFQTFKSKVDVETVGGEKANVVEIPAMGETYTWSGAESDYSLKVYAPGKDRFLKSTGDASAHEKNALSAIVLMEYANRRVLLMGDAEDETEEWLVEQFSETSYHIDVLKVGHHGSAISTSLPFIRYFTPDYAIISAGESNTHGHPTPEIMRRLFTAGIVTYRTDRHGTTVLYIDNEGNFGFGVDYEVMPENNTKNKATRMIIAAD